MTDTSAGTLDPGKLDRLFHAYGIASEFIEFSGNVASIPLEHRMNILRTMNVSVESAAQLDDLLQERAAAAYVCWLPPVVVLHEGEPGCVLMIDAREREEMAAEAGKIYWRLRMEDGSECVGECEPAALPLLSAHDCGTRVYESRQLALPPLPPGYHHAEFSSRDCSQSCLFIVAPACTWQPDCLAHRKLWGLSAQLYTLRSADNWGIGDFADLKNLIAHAAKEQAAFILLNPLHALDLRYPENASPYSPSDRRYLNPLYIAPVLCPEFSEPAMQERFNSTDVKAQLESLR
ncbi:MAG: 4-alpha-glucanotransferase, partial [Pseudomonadota bacterium]|nr:4-alpha-glucanotransferase [Pseudomonadota bacterium]